MNQLLANQVNTALVAPFRWDGLASENPLRVAAATLSSAVGDEITATTVVGVLGADDTRAFEALAAEIANEFDLDVRVRLNVGSYSVRFSRRRAI
jgi:hypothetical protein